MTNETTASQPESIGDDVQFNILADAMCWNYVENYVNGGSAEKAQQAQNARRNFIAFIDSKLRAPAAQASATIQAAPDLSSLLIHTGRDLQGAWLTDQEKFVKLSDVEALLVATIQEPVMVVEPVQSIDHDAFWVLAARCKDAKPGADYELKRNELVKYVDALKISAPMVADPAGVAKTDDRERFEALTLKKYAAATFERFTYGKYKTTWVQDHYEGWCMALAATVKAVPSAALAAIHGLIAVAGAAYHLMDNTEESGPVGASVFKHQEDDNAYLNEALDQLDALPDDQPGYVMGPCAKAEWALRHILAAPLAEKTGGGE